MDIIGGQLMVLRASEMFFSYECYLLWASCEQVVDIFCCPPIKPLPISYQSN